jgi:hypothetical protein
VTAATHTFAINTANSGQVNFVTFLGHTMSYADAASWCSSQTSPMSNLTLHHLITSPYYQLDEFGPLIYAAYTSTRSHLVAPVLIVLIRLSQNLGPYDI